MSDDSHQMKWEMRPNARDMVLFIQVVKHEHQRQWGFDSILTKAKIRSWVTKWDKEKKNNSRCKIKGRKWLIEKMCSGLNSKETEKHFIHFYAHEHGVL